MGGDDLGSDDEYLAAPPRGVEDYGDDSSAEDDEDNEDHDQQQDQKRRRGDGGDKDENNVATSNKDKTAEPTQRKSKKRGGPMEVLGSKIRLESAESKAEILSRFSGANFQSSHIAKLNSKNKYDIESNIDSNNFMDRLMCLISKKQLKNKTQQRSPRALIFCLSARRSVAVLKDLAPMKLRVAKLFPKQGTIGEQARQLENTEFGVAVGTPHRIKELIDRGSLTLKNTQLLGFDTFLNPKHQSVCTLHDTAPILKSILKNHAEPICKEGKKDLKIGFV
mmetsp:Transcript_9737/g.21028  ORF Transcript_9737/g.21028 Transcript_9737/m.21028 type:complete len:279 (-) Transcript_9737:67-903(-)